MKAEIEQIVHTGLKMAKEYGLISQDDRRAIINEFYNRMKDHNVNDLKSKQIHPVGGDEDHKEIEGKFRQSFTGVKLQ